MREKLGRIASLNGYHSSDTRLLERVNDALEEIMESEDFPCLIDTLSYPHPGSEMMFVLPNNIDRILDIKVDGTPLHIRSPWFDYVDSTYGRINEAENRSYVGLERGEVPTSVLIPDTGGPFVLKLVGEVDETTAGTVNIRGLDTAGDKIYTGAVEGVDMAFTAGSPFETLGTQEFSEITSISKPVTAQKIKIYAVTSPGGVATELVEIGANEQTPSFRQYAFPMLSTDLATTIILRGKRRFIPIVSDDDLMPVNSYHALRFMMIAQHKADTQDTDGYMTNALLCKQKMWDQAKTYRGKTKSPVFVGKPGAGLGDYQGVI
jgi:hypothetical protein